MDGALTLAQNGSAALLSVFLSLHLSAPILAAFSQRGSALSSANNALLLAREVYQRTPALELTLVFVPLALHVVSSAFIRARKRARGAKGALSAHAKAGWTLVGLVAHHVASHRLVPARWGLSPSFFSYDIVPRALSSGSLARRTLAAVSYAALVGAASYHALVGVRMLSGATRSTRTGLAPKPDEVTSVAGERGMTRRVKRQSWRMGYAALVGSAGLGIVRLANDVPFIPRALAQDYDRLLQLTLLGSAS